MTAPISGVQHSEALSKRFSLSSAYLEGVATRRAELDAGVQDVAFSCLDQLVHCVFQYVLFVFYPAYDRFYYERQVEVFRERGKELPAYVSCGLREAVLFIHRFISTPTNIGSIFPSSGSLVKAITKKVAQAAQSPGPKRYLEIGAGTGSFTEGIIARMKEGDHFDVVEYDEDLCYLLRRRFHHLKNVTIHHVSIFDYANRPYDVVVSGLPLAGFSPEFVEKAHQKYLELTKPDGFFSYFEYIGVPTIKQTFLHGQKAKEFAQVLALKEKLVKDYGREIDTVWWNITPARAVHCCTTRSSSSPLLLAARVTVRGEWRPLYGERRSYLPGTAVGASRLRARPTTRHYPRTLNSSFRYSRPQRETWYRYLMRRPLRPLGVKHPWMSL